MKNSRKEILDALGAVTQLGLSVMISFLLWIGIASWIQTKFSLGNYVMIIGVFMGIGSAVTTFIKFCQATAERGKKNEK